MNYTDRKLLKGGIKRATDYRYDNSFWQQYILTVDATGVLSRLGDAEDFPGRISMETESQRAVYGGVVRGGLS